MCGIWSALQKYQVGRFMDNKTVLAIDFGASSGRAILGSFDGGKIELKEVHRFSNDPVTVGNTMYWDVLRLFHEIKQSILKAKQFGRIDSIAIDTWGVDFALIDKDGKLLENPVHYRDSRTYGMVEECERYISPERLYDITGIQTMNINTLFQLLSLKKHRPDLLERADKMLMMPDLFVYFLTGKITAEMSIASTTQLFDVKKKCWSDEIIEAIGLKRSLFPEIVDSGTVSGMLSSQICEELNVDSCQVISVCGHDTQLAQVAVPSTADKFAFLSCGTWSLLGTELLEPVVTEQSARMNLTNETGYMGRISFLKNIIGLWLVQESRRQWSREGKEYSFADMEQMAAEAEQLKCFINPDYETFVPAGNIPKRVCEYCERTGQYVPKNEAEIIRCIYDSLAFKYREAVSELEACTGRKFTSLHMVGGGTKGRLLAEFTAESCNLTVSCGPVEATVFGNVALQLIALGVIDSLESARRIIMNSEDIKLYAPRNTEIWEEAYQKYLEVNEHA